ncbi:sporulation membrane protein YtrI [Bacillus fonticola]|uniref:sporulation membrane protein YtrI n=1 Tax=Bacillus fonticola TaxID=2728853 RepID=UPI0014727ED4|nr:sporulation membrane protein YtrI [Bacillus fonticola]
MRIPPYYRNPNWQRLFAGMALGAFLSWMIFLFIYGVTQEKQATLIQRQENDIADLKRDKLVWQERFQELNNEQQKQLTVQEIRVRIRDNPRLELAELSLYEIQEKVKDDLSVLLSKDLETVSEMRDLIKRTIENQLHRVEEKQYKLTLHETVVYTEVILILDIELASS